MSNVGTNFYKAYLAQALQEGGSETTIYVDRITTLTGESIAWSDFADESFGVLTIRPDGDGLTSFPENISFTGIDTTNLAFTGAIRGLSAKSTSVVSANKRYHAIGTPVVISWGVHSWSQLKDYVDNSVAGFTSFFAPGTAGEVVAAGNLVYFDDTDNEWKLCDADTAATVENTLLGIAQGAGIDGGAITGGVLIMGYDQNQTGLTAGAIYYASNTAGAISSSAGTKEVTIGFARSTTSLYFNPRFNQNITEDIQDALVGSSGTPSSSNKYITEDDVSNAGVSGKIVRATSTSLPALGGENLTNISLAKSLTAGETINGVTLPVPVYIKTADNEVYACDGNDQNTLDFVGFATTNSTNGNAITVKYEGIVTGFSGLTPGSKYYVQDAIGTIGTTIGTYEVLVGIAVSATEILIQKGMMEYIGESAFSVSSGNTLYTHPTGARFAIVACGASSTIGQPTDFFMTKKGRTSATYSFDGVNASDDGSYSFSWEATGIRVTEDSDPNADGSLSGTIFWYK